MSLNFHHKPPSGGLFVLRDALYAEVPKRRFFPDASLFPDEMAFTLRPDSARNVRSVFNNPQVPL